MIKKIFFITLLFPTITFGVESTCNCPKEKQRYGSETIVTSCPEGHSRFIIRESFKSADPEPIVELKDESVDMNRRNRARQAIYIIRGVEEHTKISRHLVTLTRLVAKL